MLTSAATGNQAIPAAILVPAATPAVTRSRGATPTATLKNAGLLRSVSSNYFMVANGDLYITNAACGTVDTKSVE